MARQLFSNNGESSLLTAILAADTTAILASGEGALFNSPTAGDWELLTIVEGALTEIVKVTARTTDTLTIVRAQESTTAQNFGIGAVVYGFITKATLETIQTANETNATDISTNAGLISTNATNISNNDTDITTLSGRIDSNDTDITSIVSINNSQSTAISNNTTAIATNTTDISELIDNILVNQNGDILINQDLNVLSK